MALTSGTRLGPYEIVFAIGAGGMGEVYRARDTRLQRDVALKFLPESFASNPDRLMRFEREAKTIAGLAHPHICTLFDIGRDDGTHFLVMEHLDGQTLALRLQEGALPLEDALESMSNASMTLPHHAASVGPVLEAVTGRADMPINSCPWRD